MIEEQQIVLNHSPKASDRSSPLEIRSDEVQEILSHIPNGLIRWGITMIFLAIILILVVSWLIKYPDIISSRISVTTEHPPIPMIARSTGKLILLVAKEAYVEAGQDLAVIENPADVEAVIALRTKMGALEAAILQAESPGVLSVDFGKPANLGDLQGDYSAFLQSYLDHQFFIENGYHQRKIESIEQQIAYYRELNRKLVDQEEILAREVDIARERYSNSQTLYKQELISNVDLANSESAFLQKKYSLENAKASMINHNIQLSEHQKTIMDLQQQYYEKKRALDAAIQESFKRLQNQLANWEHRYLLKAPISGYVSFFKFWSDNQYVNVGDEVMMVVPNSTDILGKIYLPAMGSGKVKPGQLVRIKFDSYPFNEFGAVLGEIESISLIARDSQYLINVNLINGLETSYGTELEFKQEMQGTADIITEDLRVFERVFNQLRSILENGFSG